MDKIAVVFLKEVFAIARIKDLCSKWLAESLVKNKFLVYVYDLEESSLICEAAHMPPFIEVEKPWMALKILGPIPFTLSGVLQAVLQPLAQQGVSVLATSTFSTDYVFFPAGQLDGVYKALTAVDLIEVRTTEVAAMSQIH